MARSIAVYVSSHGFGHAVRVSEVVGELLQRAPDSRVHVRSTSPRWLFRNRADRLSINPVSTDVGMVQPHGLSIDFAATLDALDARELHWKDAVRTEAAWLREIRARLVLGDIPPLAFDAAERAGVPSVALGNFSWDWIYGCYVGRDRRFVRHAERAAACYRKAQQLLRLPLHADMPAFRSTTDIALIARRCPVSREEARGCLRLPRGRPLVLLSFGGLGFTGIDLSALGALDDVQFLATDPFVDPPANVLCLEREQLDYPLLLRACDAVVTKPGYGIVAASIVNGVRVLYTTRDDFPETPILVRALEAHATAQVVQQDDLARGALGPALAALLARPVGETALAADGAARAAEILAAELRP
ncbi:MAG TPA: hypothetical protein VMR29_04895 [Candidatus Binatia bacterium]|nr:hypothetical protein [Candidatus Binatia bacterium]